EEAVAAVFDLLVCQGRLLQATSRLHDAEPDLLREGLRRRPHPLAFWVLLLLFNVDFSDGRVGKGSGQLLIVGRRPAEQVWKKAWSQALRMEPARGLPFLERYHAAGAAPPLYCPVKWAPLFYRFSA